MGLTNKLCHRVVSVHRAPAYMAIHDNHVMEEPSIRLWQLAYYTTDCTAHLCKRYVLSPKLDKKRFILYQNTPLKPTRLRIDWIIHYKNFGSTKYYQGKQKTLHIEWLSSTFSKLKTLSG